MAKFKNKYRIESNRYSYWDYSMPGYYFITICTKDRACVFGTVKEGKIELSEIGTIVRTEILDITNYHHRVIVNEWVVMPNHVHLILEIMAANGIYAEDNDNVEKIHEFSLPTNLRQPPYQLWWHNPDYQPTTDEIKQYRKHRRKMIIPKIIGKFKMRTSKQMNIKNSTPEYKNWQSNYHDHIIRNEKSFQNIKNYIINNPAKWNTDTFNPKNHNSDQTQQ